MLARLQAKASKPQPGTSLERKWFCKALSTWPKSSGGALLFQCLTCIMATASLEVVRTASRFFFGGLPPLCPAPYPTRHEGTALLHALRRYPDWPRIAGQVAATRKTGGSAKGYNPIMLECVSKFILTGIMQVIYEYRQGKQSPETCVPACRSE